MKTDLFETKELKKTSLRTFCVLLDEHYYLDAAEMIGDENFDTNGYNVYGEGLQLVGADWVPIYQIIAIRDLKLGEELYLESYGKLFWCYRGNFDTLSLQQQIKCRAHYNISDEDFVNVVKEPKAKKQTAKKGKKSKIVVEEVNAGPPSRKRTKGQRLNRIVNL